MTTQHYKEYQAAYRKRNRNYRNAYYEWDKNDRKGNPPELPSQKHKDHVNSLQRQYYALKKEGRYGQYLNSEEIKEAEEYYNKNKLEWKEQFRKNNYIVGSTEWYKIIKQGICIGISTLELNPNDSEIFWKIFSDKFKKIYANGRDKSPDLIKELK